mgnify:FL=1
MLILASQSSGRLATLRAAGIEPIVRVSDVDEPAVLAALARERRTVGDPGPSGAQQVQALARAKALAVAGTFKADPPRPGPVEAEAPKAGSAGAGSPGTGPLGAGAPGTDPLEAGSRGVGRPGSGGRDAGGRDAAAMSAGAFVVGCDSMLEIDGRIVGKPGDPRTAVERWRSMRGATGILHTGHTLVRLPDGATAEGVSSTVVHFAHPSDAEIEAYVATGEPLWCAGAFTIDGLGGAFVEGVEGDPHGVVGLSLPLLRRLVIELGGSWTDLWAQGRGRAETEPDR